MLVEADIDVGSAAHRRARSTISVRPCTRDGLQPDVGRIANDEVDRAFGHWLKQEILLPNPRRSQVLRCTGVDTADHERISGRRATAVNIRLQQIDGDDRLHCSRQIEAVGVG